MATGVSALLPCDDQRAAPLGRGGDAHVEHERAGELGERGVVERFVGSTCRSVPGR